MRHPRTHFPAAVLLATIIVPAAAPAIAETGQIDFAVVDQDGQPLPCRIHLRDQAGKPQRAGDLPFFRDHFVCPGKVELNLAAGSYRVEIERGPEYEQYAGSFDLAAAEKKTIDVTLTRITHLAADGWYSGDLHVHRPIEQMRLLMQAEDLHVAPVITWWNERNQWRSRDLPDDPLVAFDGNRFYQVMAGEDEREGGALMFFHRARPLDITGSSREYPSPMKFIEEARQQGDVWIDIEKPFWWDVPVWLASGKVDSVGLANNHMCRSRMYESEAWGRPRDEDRLPPPRGNGFWTQEIYYHILNCGLRIPPSAGSASGVLPNPLGYDRVYVHCGDDFGYQQWWEGLKAGRSFVTNGPLLIAKANGHLPGHVFTANQGEEIEIQIDISLTGRDNVPAIEIIQDGVVEQAVALDGHSKTGPLATLRFDRSGWFLIRAVTDLEHTFRFASTGPFYVEIGPSGRRVSRRSAQFFLDWAHERAGRVPLKLDDADKLREVLAYHDKAIEFWRKTLANASVD